MVETSSTHVRRASRRGGGGRDPPWRRLAGETQLYDDAMYCLPSVGFTVSFVFIFSDTPINFF